MKLTPSNAAALLGAMIPAGHPIMLVGPPGCGKSDLVTQACLDAGAELILSHPVVSDPTDAKGLPWIGKDGASATFLPFGDLARALAATKLTVWFLDDLGQASPAVQASFMQLLLARRVNGHVLSDCITFVAATNRRCDRAGVSGILEPVKSRFATIVEIEPSMDDWCNWAIKTGQPVEVIAFLRLRPELLHKFEATADLVNQPSPRTWANAGKILKLGLASTVEFAALCGAVGEGAATELTAFLKAFREMPNLDGIIASPDTAALPGSPSAYYAVATGLAYKANVANFSRVLRYAERIRAGGNGEFAALLVKDAIRRKADLQNTHDFTRMTCEPLGKLIAGVV